MSAEEHRPHLPAPCEAIHPAPRRPTLLHSAPRSTTKTPASRRFSRQSRRSERWSVVGRRNAPRRGRGDPSRRVKPEAPGRSGNVQTSPARWSEVGNRKWPSRCNEHPDRGLLSCHGASHQPAQKTYCLCNDNIMYKPDGAPHPHPRATGSSRSGRHLGPRSVDGPRRG